MDKDIELLTDIRAELTRANESLAKLRGNSKVLHERIELLEGRLQHIAKPFGTISANSSLICICAVVSAIALCKIAWF